ncbi:MAG TPA: hypothetical protein DEF47_03215 [Herpetosiphon sp.]|uniref:Uncharacterized protein n=2 Tax=Herpetosiphon TaxID=64 RepID=A9AUQ7_HERA2|nr:hypothetical protein Haur_1941 [Herpetosiphon aurantiacus DSM 785]HBW48901.1 hypothetical protein [Herpetosiphon sp.]
MVAALHRRLVVLSSICMVSLNCSMIKRGMIGPNAILGGFMNLSATCECGTEYDLNYVEQAGGASFSYDACPDCGIQLDRETVAEAIHADPEAQAELY